MKIRQFLKVICWRYGHTFVCTPKCFDHKYRLCSILVKIHFLFHHKCKDKRCKLLLTNLSHWWRNGCCKYTFRVHVDILFQPNWLHRIFSKLVQSLWKHHKKRMRLSIPHCGFLKLLNKIPFLIRSLKVMDFLFSPLFSFKILVVKWSFSVVIVLFSTVSLSQLTGW